LELPILTLLKESYLLWHNFLEHLPRLTRHTLGVRVDNIFTEILEITLVAQYTKREDKKRFLEELSRKLDNLKFFVALLWETKGLDTGKYGQLSQKLATAGRMLGKWTQILY
jgi:hypothetical protein